MHVIGLTGGIASGKTTISNLFAELDVPVIDTDIVSRALLTQGQPGYRSLHEKLGDAYFHEDGSIDRKKLRETVFEDPDLKNWLEAMLHPLIYQSSQQQLAQCSDSKYAILVVPLLFEKNFETLVDRVLVVDCARDTQLERLRARDNIDDVLATRMLDQQWTNEQRLARADDVIHNNQNENLKLQVENLHQRYLTI